MTNENLIESITVLLQEQIKKYPEVNGFMLIIDWKDLKASLPSALIVTDKSVNKQLLTMADLCRLSLKSNDLVSNVLLSAFQKFSLIESQSDEQLSPVRSSEPVVDSD